MQAANFAPIVNIPLSPKICDKPLDGLLGLFDGRILPFDTDAARRYADLAVAARNAGKGFPTPDGYIAAIAAIATAHSFAAATRDASAFKAAGVPIIDPWTTGR